LGIDINLMKIVFTLCSNNYLAQAKVLGDSLLKYNPDFRFIIGLVDKKNIEIDYSFFIPHEVITIEDIGLTNFEGLWQKFNIIELNTAVKSSFIKYLFKLYPEAEFVFYFDPDIMIFGKLSSLENEFSEAKVLLTPHVITPIEVDDLWPGENTFLNYGIYNLGFIGVKNDPEVLPFLDWWEDRTLKLGFIRPCEGIFVDQLWINLAPLFFKGFKILFSLGFNAAPWNLHERKKINYDSEKFVMTDQSTLTFYHFSSYNYKRPDLISKYYDRYTFDNCPDLKKVYSIYQQLLVENKVEFFSRIPCYYVEKRTEIEREKNKISVERKIKNSIREFVPPIMWKVVKRAVNKLS
jgi:hypothetical protein